MRNRTSLLLIAALPIGLHAQSAQQFITWGDNALRMGDRYGASRFYKEALEQQPGTLELQWKYAEACRLSDQYPQAAEQYAKVYRKDLGRTHPEALRWLGEMQLCSGAYEEAAKTWQRSKQKEKDKRSVAAQRADNALEGCRLAKEAMAAPEAVTIEHIAMPVNSYDSEFAPRIGPDSLLYFSSLRGDVNDDGELADTTAYHVGILRVDPRKHPLPEAAWVSAALRAGDEANSAWSVDGSWFYFTRCTTGAPCVLHAAQLVGGLLTEGAPLTGIDPSVTSTQPMVATVDGEQRLFFTSDRAGGTGGMDLWTARIDGATVSDVKPLSAVNTPGNEVTPFFDAVQRKLYFSSDFLPGLGGYDNFMSALGPDGYAAPVNFGYPLNSPANDLYPTFDAASMSGWFTSNRIGSFAKKGETCCNDLYRYSYPDRPPILPGPPKPLPPDTAHLPEHPADDVAWKRITSLREKLPIRLYFHNDEPGPRSWDTTTAADYAATYRAYKALLPDYHRAWQGNANGTSAIDAFFRDEVDHGFAQLNDFIGLLRQALQEGQRIELQVRGFASPLAKTDYNTNLSLRRIQSMVNYLRTVDDGALAPYLDGTAPNGGRLTIRKSPFGEDTSAGGVSDRLEDLRNSVYGVGASRERRIEIEQVDLGH